MPRLMVYIIHSFVRVSIDHSNIFIWKRKSVKLSASQREERT